VVGSEQHIHCGQDERGEQGADGRPGHQHHADAVARLGPGPGDEDQGMWPNTVAAVVISAGRKRVIEAFRIPTSLERRCSCSRLGNSTIRTRWRSADRQHENVAARQPSDPGAASATLDHGSPRGGRSVEYSPGRRILGWIRCQPACRKSGWSSPSRTASRQRAARTPPRVAPAAPGRT
jgi:hypothetical protein